jgi:hypothetical protein
MAAASEWLREHPCPEPWIGTALVDSITRYDAAADTCLRTGGPVDQTSLEVACVRFTESLHDLLGRLQPGPVDSA